MGRRSAESTILRDRRGGALKTRLPDEVRGVEFIGLPSLPVAGRKLLNLTSRLGRNLGVLPYRPAFSSPDEWEAAYRAGMTDYYAKIEELARYSVLAAYIGYAGDKRNILDVGCGRGLLRRRLESQPFASYLGVDVAPSAIAQARGLMDERTRFRCVDFMDLDDAGPIDAVVLNEVLYMVRDPQAALLKVQRVLAPQGVVLTSIWRHPGDRVLWRALDRMFTRVDAVMIRNCAYPRTRSSWRVSYHRL